MTKMIEQYLRDHLEKNIIDFSIRASITTKNHVVLYIHPTGKDGETADYEVHDDQLFIRESPMQD